MLKLDTRESELFDKCKNLIETNKKWNYIQIRSEMLPLGDVLLFDQVVENDVEAVEANVDCVLVERKTVADLAASIKDGRYDEQSYRLKGLAATTMHSHNILYLIEGAIENTACKAPEWMRKYRQQQQPAATTSAATASIDRHTLFSALLSINHYKGFSVMRTMDCDETAFFLCNSVHKMVTNRAKGVAPCYQLPTAAASTAPPAAAAPPAALTPTSGEEDMPPNQPTERDYCTVVKKVKKENVTAKNIGEIMLCQIPGIGSSVAIALLEQFGTLPRLMHAIEEDRTCLDTVKTVDEKGNARKISSTVKKKLCEYLTHPHRNDAEV